MGKIAKEIRAYEDEIGVKWETENTTPCTPDSLRFEDYFDQIYGTSTGGLIAIMIGRLGMTIGECLEAYRKIPGLIFGHRRPISCLILGIAKYDENGINKACGELVERYSPDNDLLANPDGKCEA